MQDIYKAIEPQRAELVDEPGNLTGEHVLCRAYKPTHYRCSTESGDPVAQCCGCEGWGRCEWTFFELQQLMKEKE